MANKEFILQGFTPKTHKDAIAELFGVDDIQRIILSVAFVSSGGVGLIAAGLAPHSHKATAFIGIRNDITSLQAVKQLLDIGVTLYVVDTGSRRVIYHPKIYFVRGQVQTRLIVGSANLTPGGLNNNIEAGVIAECDMGNRPDQLLVESIEGVFNALPAEYPENILHITTAVELDALHAKGLLVDEATAAPPRPAASGSSTENDSVPRIRLKVAPIKTALAAAKKSAKEAVSQKKSAFKRAEAVDAPTPVPATTGVAFDKVWESKALTRRDLDVPLVGTNTNRTGSINLDKGLLADDIDHRHYFRDEVFDALTWTASRKPKVEEAYAKFQLVVKGISYGEFDLRIAHSTNTASITYQQRNAMTRLSWGPVRDFVARPDLIDRSLALYRDRADPTRFVLEID
jgi:hypothetical protein